MSRIPTGYKDEDAFLKEARERFQEGLDADRLNRDEAKKDLLFFSGAQWEQEDLTARTGLPCLTINTLPQFVAQVVGDIRINRPAIRVRPAEDADKELAEVREGIIRYIEHKSDAQGVYANAGQSQVAGGIGNFRVVLEYARADAFERDICIKRIDNPFAVVWDPFLTEPTGKDARYCFVSDDMPRSAFEARYPDQKPESMGDEVSSTLQANGWLSKDTVRVTEYWLMKETPADIVQTQDGKTHWVTKDNEADLMAQVAMGASGQPMRRKSVKRTACMYLISGHAILEGPVEHQIDRVPVFRVPGWEVNTGGKVVRFGLVRFARDPQRLKNYWRSVAAQKLALAPRQQWLLHESAEGEDDDFRTAANNGDTVLVWRGTVEPKRMDPPQIETALLQEAALNAQDMKDVTGLHDASLGARSNETSGKAIMARQREGDVASYIYHDNLKAAIAECGRVVNDYIPQTFDTTREIAVLGMDEQQTVTSVNDPGNPESVDLSQGKYDVVVETGPSYSTKRQEASESMMQFAQAVPVLAQVAGDLMAKAQDWPMAEEIGERLKRAMPPQITADPNEPQAPDPHAEEKAQAAQMAQQGATLELRIKDAQARKAEADAAKAEAEAAMAEADAHIAAANFQAGAHVQQSDPVLIEAQQHQALASAAKAHIGAAQAMRDFNAPPTPADIAQEQGEGMNEPAAPAEQIEPYEA